MWNVHRIGTWSPLKVMGVGVGWGSSGRPTWVTHLRVRARVQGGLREEKEGLGRVVAMVDVGSEVTSVLWGESRAQHGIGLDLQSRSSSHDHMMGKESSSCACASS